MGRPFKAAKTSSAGIYIYGITNSLGGAFKPIKPDQ